MLLVVAYTTLWPSVLSEIRAIVGTYNVSVQTRYYICLKNTIRILSDSLYYYTELEGKR